MNLINSILLSYWHPLLKELDENRNHPQRCQQKVLSYLLHSGRETLFGKEHQFSSIRGYEEFKRNVPLRDYDSLQQYIDKLRLGEDYVLWNQKVKWFAQSSGTSSEKSKFIPVTPDNLNKCHYAGFQSVIASYINNNPKSKLLCGKSLTLGGSIQAEVSAKNNYYCGDLSAILLKNSPLIAEITRVPSKPVAMIAELEKKMEMICKKCSKQNITNFSGVPSWNLLLIRRLLEYNQVDYLTDIWPDIELFMHGGISFDPYREEFSRLIPSNNMHYLENYNASEGFFALQDDLNVQGMMLTLSNGVFYEFIPMERFKSASQDPQSLREIGSEAIPIEGVTTNTPYAMIISTNSGLWRYFIGDCVMFTSTSPYRVVMHGRTKLYINTFGEELMIGNAEKALAATCKETGISVSEYTVAPLFMEEGKRGSHEWVIELSPSSKTFRDSSEVEMFADILDRKLCECNSDYEHKREPHNAMDRLHLTIVPNGTFYKWMESRGKLGGQNKVPRLCEKQLYVNQLKGLAKNQTFTSFVTL